MISQRGRRGPSGLAALILLSGVAFGPAIESAEGQGLPGDTVVSIGAFQEPANEVFGWIGDAHVSRGGEIFILDFHLPGLFWFDSAGTFVEVHDRKGGGPGELKEPLAITFDQAGRLLLLDPGNTRVSTYDLSSGRFTFVRSFRLRSGAHDLCGIDANMVLAGADHENLLHLVDSTGDRIRSFAELLVPNGAIERDLEQLSAAHLFQLNMALVACDPASGTIVAVQRTMPVVRAFDVNGNQLWRTDLADLDSPRWRVDQRGSLDPWGYGQEAIAEAAQVAIGDDGLVYITFLESTAASPEAGLELRRFRLEDGQEVDRMPVGGRIFAVQGGHAFLHDRYPFPHIVVVRLSTDARPP